MFETSNTNEVISLHKITNHLKSINKMLESLDEDLTGYRKEIKNQMYTYYTSTENFSERIKSFAINKDIIQKELKVYHYYKEFTLRVLCQAFCNNEQP